MTKVLFTPEFETIPDANDVILVVSTVRIRLLFYVPLLEVFYRWMNKLDNVISVRNCFNPFSAKHFHHDDAQKHLPKSLLLLAHRQPAVRIGAYGW